MTPTLPEEAVKAAQSELSRIIGEWERNREFFNVTPEAKKNFIRRQASALSALEPSAAQVQVSGNSGQLKSAPDMGNPITDKTVKRRVADALESVWSALDCDVDQIERVITHMLANGLRIVETVAPVSDGVDTIEVGIPATELSTASKMEVVAETGIPATEPSAARQLALEEGDLNARLKAKGMYSIDEMMGNLPIDKWRVHSGMTDLTFFGEWLERKSREYLTMKAAYDVGDKDESDELYEWVLAHYGAFHDVLVNFRAALSTPDHADAGKVEGDGRADLERFWRPISEADKSITFEQTFDTGDGKSMTIRNSDHYWVRDADGRVYEATWSDHKGGYWWDLEGESPVDPVEYMPHPPSLRSAPASEKEKS
ncbi:hypothetical protein [Brucella intermedia]|uniref:hypothetical protein n=1 Tax=Brucella intermedia TaxID=94625 RepID=UPI0009891EE8|nr:hypothetical protein [Brucella intermedia]OOC51183.1 hypothetical protein AS855_01040 [Brucella intermedia M86]